MKQPDSIKKVTLPRYAMPGIFPPLGFLEIEEGSDGAGDNFAMYWPIGRESEEPIICVARHEEMLLVPEFLNLDAFLEWWEETEGQHGPAMNLKDTTFFLNLFNRARVLSKLGKTEEAIEKLEQSTVLFCEYSDSWALLAENYYKIGQNDKADLAALNSIVSNYCFGLPTKKALEQFNRIDLSGFLKDNPLIKQREILLSGGSYVDPLTFNFDKLLEVIAEFKATKDFRSAMIMEQNYGYLMLRERGEVRDRYNFDKKLWEDYFKKEMLNFYPDRTTYG